MKKEKSFEEKLNDLNEILSKMQSSETKLEDSIKLYEQAVTLIEDCKTTLTAAELRIEEISSKLLAEEDETL